MPKVIVLVIVCKSCVRPFFLEMAAIIKKNLIRIGWRAITTTNNEMKKAKTLNSCRTTDK